MRVLTERQDEDALALELGYPSPLISRAPALYRDGRSRRRPLSLLRGYLRRAALKGRMECGVPGVRDGRRRRSTIDAIPQHALSPVTCRGPKSLHYRA